MRNGGLNSPPVTDFFAVPDLDAGSAMSALSMIMEAVMISPTARVFKATEVDVPKSLILYKNLVGKLVVLRHTTFLVLNIYLATYLYVCSRILIRSARV